jgi:hypothetical protein
MNFKVCLKVILNLLTKNFGFNEKFFIIFVLKFSEYSVNLILKQN